MYIRSGELVTILGVKWQIKSKLIKSLRSRTQGRGNYSMFFEKYEQVPKNVQEKVLADHKK